jgi:hypothetical protein
MRPRKYGKTWFLTDNWSRIKSSCSIKSMKIETMNLRIITIAIINKIWCLKDVRANAPVSYILMLV